jgi:YHS domain-containing protein
MSHTNRTHRFLAAAMSAAVLTSAAGLGPAWAQAPGGADHSHTDGHAGHDHADHDHGAGMASRGPHGGQVSEAGGIQFEVFYGPQETRLYPYNAQGQSISARGMGGEIIMRVRGNDQEYRFPLEYAQSQRGDSLVARVDVSRVRDGDMQATFELRGLPSRSVPAARFAQTFALSREPLTVAVAELTAADQPGIARQKICPVMDTPLGDHGAPIKLLVGNRPLYVCCKGCIGKVQSNPEQYLRKVGGGENAPGAAAQMSVAYATAEDAAAVRAQGRCVVMTDQQLGGHGKPIKVTVGEQSLFVCCKGCLRKVEQNPELYLAKAREMRSGR